jgi:threonine synthase
MSAPEPAAKALEAAGARPPGPAGGAYVERLGCLRCAREVGEDEAFGGCAVCAGAGVPANVLPLYDFARLAVPGGAPSGKKAGALPEDPAQPGLFRYRSLLPLRPDTIPVSLGEGRTPLVAAARLGEALGAPGLLVKDETRNPTWSYKDRLAAVAVTGAVEAGRDTVVVATTGNHGAAVAAYAAAAGLRCVALTLASVPLTMKVLMQVYGAEVVALRSGPERWALMAEAVKRWGWVPVSGYQAPPIGSNPFGVDGYKTIAYELYQQLGRAPDVVVVPTAYGDGLAGIERGFQDLLALGLVAAAPRMVAAEPYGPYRSALTSGAELAGPVPVPREPSAAFSTATPVGTYQGLLALRRSGGSAVAIGDDATILGAQALAARTQGLYLEAATAVGVAAIADLARRGELRPSETVVLIGTSTGLKDVGATAARLPQVPVIDASLAELERALAAGDRPPADDRAGHLGEPEAAG